MNIDQHDLDHNENQVQAPLPLEVPAPTVDKEKESSVGKMTLGQAYEQVSGAFFEAILEIGKQAKTEPELNFFKTSCTGPKGEIYLIQIQHVAGPKFQYKDYPEPQKVQA
jgi:hypothetical protein